MTSWYSLDLYKQFSNFAGRSGCLAERVQRIAVVIGMPFFDLGQRGKTLGGQFQRAAEIVGMFLRFCDLLVELRDGSLVAFLDSQVAECRIHLGIFVSLAFDGNFQSL